MLLEEASASFAEAGIDLSVPLDILHGNATSMLSTAWYFPPAAGDDEHGGGSLVGPF
jgi:hypothetical protein